MVKNTLIEPFEIEVYVFTGTPVGPKYFLNEKRLIIKYTSAQVDTTTKQINWKQETILNKELSPTEALMNISKIPVNKYEGIPHEMCEGYTITIILKKNNQTKQVQYACAKSYDNYSKQIIQFINDNTPDSLLKKYTHGMPISL